MTPRTPREIIVRELPQWLSEDTRDSTAAHLLHCLQAWGWVVVPREPTDWMCRMAQRVGDPGDDTEEAHAARYKAMVAAYADLCQERDEAVAQTPEDPTNG